MNATSICARARVFLTVAASAAAATLALPAAAGCAIGVPELPGSNGSRPFERSGLVSAVYRSEPGQLRPR